MYAVIDIGSNTIRLSIYKKTEKSIKLLINQKFTAGLAGAVNKKGELTKDGMNRAVEALSDFKVILNNMKVKDIFVFATASLRNITNTDAAVQFIQNKTGFVIDIITGLKEAEYAFIGATHFLSLASGIVIDIGGGSTELVFYKHGEIEKSLSLPIGSLNLYTKHVNDLLPNEKEFKKLEKVIDDFISMVNVKNKYKVICGVGGSIRAAKKLNNELNDNHKSNREITKSELAVMMEGFKKDKNKAVKDILKVAPDRIHTLIPGMTILDMIAKKYKCEKIIVSEYGVREGYLYTKLFLEAN